MPEYPHKGQKVCFNCKYITPDGILCARYPVRTMVALMYYCGEFKKRRWRDNGS